MNIMTPIKGKRAKILCAITIRGLGYKVRLQLKRRLEPDGTAYDFILVRWLDPKTNLTVVISLVNLYELDTLSERYEAITTPEQRKALKLWTDKAIQDNRIK